MSLAAQEEAWAQAFPRVIGAALGQLVQGLAVDADWCEKVSSGHAFLPALHILPVGTAAARNLYRRRITPHAG